MMTYHPSWRSHHSNLTSTEQAVVEFRKRSQHGWKPSGTTCTPSMQTVPSACNRASVGGPPSEGSPKCGLQRLHDGVHRSGRRVACRESVAATTEGTRDGSEVDLGLGPHRHRPALWLDFLE